ncbi:unnamed protein product [Bemisia tabaci]|uniref:Uncharacterized protein n=1 Tax=Bemisia tabaci TaxID=7038 RepID=A0A9P0A6E8_BEMTA|nr:unnamed protein product [Bemisia tabaci]
MIIESKFYDEFDDLINSLKDERVTSKTFPPAQLYKLVAQSPELHDTIYDKSPYLIYHTGRFSFNLHEVEAGGDIVRGALQLPLIRSTQDNAMNIMVKKMDTIFKVVNPIFVTAHTQQSVENCRREHNTYYCAESDLIPAKMRPLNSDVYSHEGMVILNDKQQANIKNKRKNDSLQLIVGPAICTKESTFPAPLQPPTPNTTLEEARKQQYNPNSILFRATADHKILNTRNHQSRSCTRWRLIEIDYQRPQRHASVTFHPGYRKHMKAFLKEQKRRNKIFNQTTKPPKYRTNPLQYDPLSPAL